MKLYYSPGACSLAPHIALREAGMNFDIEKVDLKEKKMAAGGDYRTVNPKGAVPALKLDDGGVLTEVAVILQYIAEKNPGAKLGPNGGAMDRTRLQEWLNFVATEIHKGLGPMFNPRASDDWKGVVKEMVGGKFEYLSKQLENKQFLMGDRYTIADSYLYTILNWTNFVGMDLGKWPVLKAYFDRIAARPAVKKAMEAEGLLKPAQAA